MTLWNRCIFLLILLSLFIYFLSCRVPKEEREVTEFGTPTPTGTVPLSPTPSIAGSITPIIPSAGFLSFSPGGAFGCAIYYKEGNILKCWGENGGLLGLGDTDHRDTDEELGANLPAIDLGGNPKVVSSGAAVSCAILDDDSLKCWGRNEFGQLGQGDNLIRGDGPDEMGSKLNAVNLGSGKTVSAVAVGEYMVCVILADGAVKCFGENGAGQLGAGDADIRGTDPNHMGDNLHTINLGNDRYAKKISITLDHACVLLDNDTVKCWGLNNEGQLGIGDVTVRGTVPSHMGDNLSTVDLGEGVIPVAVAAGNNHSCALLNNGTVKCWGGNSQGQLGVGDQNNRGDNPGEMGLALHIVDLGSSRTAVAIDAGTQFTCALLDNETVKCWGDSGSGQTGQETTIDVGIYDGDMGDLLPAIKLGTNKKVQSISVGHQTVCALLNDSTVKCWGAGYYGGLGNGDSKHRGVFTGQMGNNLPPVKFGL